MGYCMDSFNYIKEKNHNCKAFGVLEKLIEYKQNDENSSSSKKIVISGNNSKKNSESTKSLLRIQHLMHNNIQTSIDSFKYLVINDKMNLYVLEFSIIPKTVM